MSGTETTGSELWVIKGGATMSFKQFRRKSKDIAKALYGEQIARQILKATTESEILRILVDARHAL